MKTCLIPGLQAGTVVPWSDAHVRCTTPAPGGWRWAATGRRAATGR